MMMWVFAVLIVLAMGVIALLAAGRGEPMQPAYDDRPDALVPEGRPLGAEDLRRVRFSLAFRGYRMSEVDALLERLAAEREAAEAAGASAAADRVEEATGAGEPRRPRRFPWVPARARTDKR
ncbi:DivIVA domain-containing protein [Nocardioides sp. YIM 152588]|uniref:DivIVA domain-containing protein n=1 Tax=Nocardioides sp. YIM 152588 TaxID=3158259 RepID=UPI0032E39209